jgi:hypothetical protein
MPRAKRLSNLPDHLLEPAGAKRSPGRQAGQTLLQRSGQTAQVQAELENSSLLAEKELDKLAGVLSSLGPLNREKTLVRLQRTRGNAYVNRLVDSAGKTSRAVLQRQKPKKPGEKDESTAGLEITTSNIDDAIKIMWKTYQILVRKRRDAVDQLSTLTDKDAEEPKGFLEDLLLQTLASAVLGPTGLIGTLIADKIIPNKELVAKIVGKLGGETEVTEALEDASVAARATNLSIGSSINTATTEGLKKTYNELKPKDEDFSDKVRKLFFLTQKRFLSDESDKVEIYFLNNADQFRQLEAKKAGLGIVALKALQESVLSTVEQADQAQQDASLTQWLIYMSRKEAGVHKPEAGRDLGWVQEGTDLESIVDKGAFGMVPSTRGVLFLWIEPNQDNPTAPVTVKRAMLKGLNKGLREHLASRAIGDLGIPIVAWSMVGGRPYFSIGINESGAVFYSTKGCPYPKSALQYLYFKSRPDKFYEMAKAGFKDIDTISMDELTKEAPLAVYTIDAELGKITLDQAKVEINEKSIF